MVRRLSCDEPNRHARKRSLSLQQCYRGICQEGSGKPQTLQSR